MQIHIMLNAFSDLLCSRLHLHNCQKPAGYMAKLAQNTNLGSYLLNSYSCSFNLLSPLLGPRGPTAVYG